MSNFEDKFGMEIKSREIEEGYEKALKIIEKSEIHEEDFRNFYGNEVVDGDIRYVEAYKKEEKKNEENQTEKEKLQKKLSVILEAILCYKASTWYGENVLVRKASPLDDKRYKTDLIMQFLDEDSDNDALALGIDCTFEKSQDKKFKAIKKGIESGDLGEVKYFDPQKGRREKVPHVVIGVRENILSDMNGLLIEDEKGLDSHWASYEFISEILFQLYAFREYAQEEKNKEIEEIYDKSFSKVKKIFINLQLKHKDASAHQGIYFLDIVKSLKNVGIVTNEHEFLKGIKEELLDLDTAA